MDPNQHYKHGSTQIHALPRGPLETNCYIAIDTVNRRALIVDTPCDSSEDILRRISGFTTEAIVLTHGHWDHTGDADEVARLCGAPILIGAADEHMLVTPQTYGFPLPRPLLGRNADRLVRGGDTVECGTMRFEVLDIPGHTAGHIGLYESHLGILFAGDVLFRGGIGRSDLPGGSYDTLLESITRTLLHLPSHTIVYPGHGDPTTIGDEASRNPFILDYLDHFG